MEAARFSELTVVAAAVVTLSIPIPNAVGLEDVTRTSSMLSKLLFSVTATGFVLLKVAVVTPVPISLPNL